MLLESVERVFENGIEDEDPNFAMQRVCCSACLGEEGKELGPCSVRHFDGSDGSDDTRCRMADQVTVSNNALHRAVMKHTDNTYFASAKHRAGNFSLI